MRKKIDDKIGCIFYVQCTNEINYMNCLKSNKLTFLYMVLKKRRRLVLLQDTNFHIRLLQDDQIVVLL